jgi:hypothetical protein
LLLPDIVDRRIEVDGVLGCGKIGSSEFWQVCHFSDYVAYCLFIDAFPARYLNIAIACHPHIEDATVASLLAPIEQRIGLGRGERGNLGVMSERKI